MLEKTFESPLDYNEIQPVHPKGDQSWVFIGRTDAEAETPILWPPHAKSWLVGKDPNVGRDLGQEEKETTEDSFFYIFNHKELLTHLHYPITSPQHNHTFLLLPFPASHS